jgi:hypothetical protein
VGLDLPHCQTLAARIEVIMKLLSLCLPVLTLVVCAGCSTNPPGTSAMGAGPTTTASSEERTLYCKDGSYVTKSVGCAAGVERELTPRGEK